MTGLATSTPSVARGKGSSIPRLAPLWMALLLLLAGCSSGAQPTTGPTAAPSTAGPTPVATAALTPTPAPTPPAASATAAPTATAAPITAAPATPSPTVPPTATPSPTAASAFPVTVVDDESTSVTIPAEPQHIVSLAPSNTEIVFALGAGTRLVAGTDADDYPAEAAALPDAVVATKVLKEQIASLDPDLILAYGNGFTPPGDVTQLRQLGYPVIVLYASSLAAAERDISLIATAVGAKDRADTMLAEMHRQFAAIEAVVPPTATHPRTFYEVGYGPGIYTPSADSAYTEMIRLAGGDPITTDASFTISLEALVKADPEVIILGDAAYGVCPDQIAGRKGWKTMTAVKAGAIRPAFDTVVTRPGPRLPLGLASLVRGIHPDVVLPADIPPEPVLCATP
jgi:iron complex transport system substrate-binding protein